MKNKSKQKTVKVFLDLEKTQDLNDDLISTIYIDRINSNKKSIIKRFKIITESGVLYDTPSVRLYHEAKDLFILGYFKPTIMVCRSTAEYLAYELFFQLIDIDGDIETIKKIAESLDFRKIVNDFLFKDKDPLVKEKTSSKQIFNDLYTIGNNWIHPKSIQNNLNLEKQAKDALFKLLTLLKLERNVFTDYSIDQGKLKKKEDSRNYKRGIQLGDKI